MTKSELSLKAKEIAKRYAFPFEHHAGRNATLRKALLELEEYYHDCKRLEAELATLKQENEKQLVELGNTHGKLIKRDCVEERQQALKEQMERIFEALEKLEPYKDFIGTEQNYAYRKGFYDFRNKLKSQLLGNDVEGSNGRPKKVRRSAHS